MPELLSDTGVGPLILELLARRNWFDPQRLEEIEQTLQKAKAGTLSEVTLIKAGLHFRAGGCQRLRRGLVPSGGQQQRGGWRRSTRSSALCCRRSSAWID